ncbi:hypothetical protein DFS34DRAFT_248271 [Phlyctochytrium arcticum]|nr:hypothetical protein DFS34DRAFT_248271 [Phlyctochytrium arcticum]
MTTGIPTFPRLDYHRDRDHHRPERDHHPANNRRASIVATQREFEAIFGKISAQQQAQQQQQQQAQQQAALGLTGSGEQKRTAGAPPVTKGGSGRDPGGVAAIPVGFTAGAGPGPLVVGAGTWKNREADDELSPTLGKSPAKTKKHTIFTFNNKTHDLTILKRNSLVKHPTPRTATFHKILFSSRFDQLLIQGAKYGRAHVRWHTVEKAVAGQGGGMRGIRVRGGGAFKRLAEQADGPGDLDDRGLGAGNDGFVLEAGTGFDDDKALDSAMSKVPETTFSSSSAINPNGLLSPGSANSRSRANTLLTPAASVISPPTVPPEAAATMTLEEARKERALGLKEFALAYCFLVLFVSRNVREPAKERGVFEHIYTLSKDLIPTIVAQPAFTPLLAQDLDRLFRSSLFSRDTSMSKPAPSMHPSHPFLANPFLIQQQGRSGSGDAAGADLGSFGSMQALGGPERVGSGRGTRRREVWGEDRDGGGEAAGGGIPDSEGRVRSAGAQRTASARSNRSEREFGRQKYTAFLLHATSAALNIVHRKISINAVRMARSPLADTVLPPPQRFLFVQTRSNVIGSLVGG